MNMQVLDARPDARSGYKVDVTRGERVGRVVRVHSTLGVDVLELDVGGEVSFVPCLKELVLTIDAARRRVDLAPEALGEE